MYSPWIETFTGKKFDILNPSPEMICIEDIAHSLSQLCRFTGHTRIPYPVAQHSYLGSFIVPKQDRLWFLLHDSAEAYLGDMNKPLKHYTDAGKAYQLVERKVMFAICNTFSLPLIEPDSVRKADLAMLFAEKEQLMTKLSWGHIWGDTEPADVQIEEMSSTQIEKLFLKRFYKLKEK